MENNNIQTKANKEIAYWENEKPVFVVIVAGGVGTRMNNSTPKQFLELCGKPILLHTVQKFIDCITNLNLILVLPVSQFKIWENIYNKYNFNHPILLAEGGETRYHSVKNGLEFVPENCLVGIHDAARPLVSHQTILNSFKMAQMQGNASPCIPQNESIREVNGNKNWGIDRTKIAIMQTPQCFQSSLLRKAFLLDYQTSFTDDATVLEAIGEKINLVDGNKENIKITTPQDLIIAEALMKMSNT